MKTNENQKTTNHQPAAQKPFFGATPDHTFFSAERAASPAFFQPKAISPSAIQAKSATSEAEGITQPLQRMPAFESEITANGEVHRKLINSPASPIQAKLTIGEPGDKYEQEADRVASQVVEQINAPASAQSTQGESLQRQEESEEELQAKPEITTLQRMEEKPEELQAKSTLQRQEAIAGGEASTDLTSAINSARGSGQSLDAGLQRSIGQAMGADFSGVRVHTDTQADQLNQSIQAKAFTTGQNVFFRQGAYEPESRGGQQLIAHELTHVVQQKGKGDARSKPLQKKRNRLGTTTEITQGSNWGVLQRDALSDAKNLGELYTAKTGLKVKRPHIQMGQETAITTDKVKKWITKLVTDAVGMKKPPEGMAVSVLGFGSFAREELTMVSDIDLHIAIQGREGEKASEEAALESGKEIQETVQGTDGEKASASEEAALESGKEIQETVQGTDGEKASEEAKEAALVWGKEIQETVSSHWNDMREKVVPEEETGQKNALELDWVMGGIKYYKSAEDRTQEMKPKSNKRTGASDLYADSVSLFEVEAEGSQPYQTVRSAYEKETTPDGQVKEWLEDWQKQIGQLKNGVEVSTKQAILRSLTLIVGGIYRRYRHKNKLQETAVYESNTIKRAEKLSEWGLINDVAAINKLMLRGLKWEEEAGLRQWQHGTEIKKKRVGTNKLKRMGTRSEKVHAALDAANEKCDR